MELLHIVSERCFVQLCKVEAVHATIFFQFLVHETFFKIKRYYLCYVGVVTFLSLFFPMQRAYRTLKQNLVQFEYIQVFP